MCVCVCVYVYVCLCVCVCVDPDHTNVVDVYIAPGLASMIRSQSPNPLKIYKALFF